MRKLIYSILFGIIAVFLLCACGRKPYTTEEVKDYIEKELKIKNYQLVKEKEQINKANVWTGRLDDGSNQLFHVADFPSEDLFGVNHYLSDDYEDVMADYESSKYFGAQNLEKEVSLYDDVLTETVFIGHYADRKDLEELISESRELLDFINNSEHPVNLSFNYKFVHPLRGCASSLTSFDDDADAIIYAKSDISKEQEQEAFDRMLIMCEGLNYTELLKDFSKDRVNGAIARSSSCIGICYGRSDRDKYVYYDDICGSVYAGAISYPTVYKMLIKEGIAVTGDINHYSFTGKDGSSYEVFYDYHDADVIRCLKDGEDMPANWLFAHFTQKEVGSMIGGDVMVWKMDYQPNENVYASNGNIRQISKFILDGDEMTYQEVPDGKFRNITYNYKKIYYDEERDTYMMYMDVGWTSDSQSVPYINHEWVKALGGVYLQEKAGFIEKLLTRNDIYKTKWKIGSDTYTTKAEFSDGKVESYEVKKNGKKVELNYVTSEQSTSVGATFIIAVPIDEFADLFGLTYSIDQVNEMVSFFSDSVDPM